MDHLVRAIPSIEAMLSEPVTLVGGLAVMARLRRAHRATIDVDTVRRRETGGPSSIELLLAQHARPDGSGVSVEIAGATVHVDVLEVTNGELRTPSDDPNDRLQAASFAWAIDSATVMELRVATLAHRVRVAQPGPLIAMKLKALEDRSRAKLGTDVLDIGALVRDQATADVAFQQLLSAPSQLRDDAAAHVRRWLALRRREVWDAARLVESLVGMDDIAATADFLLGCLED